MAAMRAAMRAAMAMMVVAGGLGAAAQGAGDPVFGLWRTPEGDAVIEIAPCDRGACGRVARLDDPLDALGQPLRDRNNPDAALRDRAICGMEMLHGFKHAGTGRWTGGAIYSARNGKTYSAEMTVEPDGRLTLRGYVGLPIFGESQVWTRETAAAPAC